MGHSLSLTSYPEGKAEQAAGIQARTQHASTPALFSGCSFLHPELTLKSAPLCPPNPHPCLRASLALGFSLSD